MCYSVNLIWNNTSWAWFIDFLSLFTLPICYILSVVVYFSVKEMNWTSFLLQKLRILLVAPVLKRRRKFISLANAWGFFRRERNTECTLTELMNETWGKTPTVIFFQFPNEARSETHIQNLNRAISSQFDELTKRFSMFNNSQDVKTDNICNYFCPMKFVKLEMWRIFYRHIYSIDGVKIYIDYIIIHIKGFGKIPK